VNSEKGRLEAFSDGVFAIAITLLILEIKVPHDDGHLSNRELASALLHLWPSFLAFLTSFLTILIMWVNHHGLFHLVQHMSRGLKFANGMLLLVVTFIPFPTALLAQHLNTPAAATAAVFYCGTYILVSISYLATLREVSRPHVRRDDVPPDHWKKIWQAYRWGFVTYASAAALAWFFPLTATLLCSVLWVLWTRLDYRPAHERI
jgi:uncharacterized membrane protein